MRLVGTLAVTTIVLSLGASPVRGVEADVAARWSFECDQKPLLAVDGSGHDNHAALTGTTRVDGPWGRALRFPPAGEASAPYGGVPTPPGSTLNAFDAGITLEAFINPDALPIPPDVANRRIRYVLWADDDIFTLALRSDDAGATTLVGGINCGRRASGVNDVSAVVPFDNARAGTWSHVALTFGANVLRLFIDGQKVAEVTDGGTPACGSTVGPVSSLREFVALGVDETEKSGQRNFRGLMDEVVVWRRPLGEAEVLAESQRTGPGAVPTCDVTSDVCLDPASCDDGDACTIESCRAFTCQVVTPVSVPLVKCEVERLKGAPDLCADPLVRKAQKLVQQRSTTALRLLAKITAKTKPPKIRKLLRNARRQLDRLEAKLKAGKLSAQVSASCRDTLLDLISDGRSFLDAYARQGGA